MFSHRILGLWDEGSQKLAFIRIVAADNLSTFQIYTGYLFTNPEGIPHTSTIAGSFEAFSGTGATPQRMVYGWYAHGPYFRL